MPPRHQPGPDATRMRRPFSLILHVALAVLASSTQLGTGTRETATLYGEDGTARLLIFSQVILSMQLPLAVIPLPHEAVMGRARSSWAAAKAARSS